MARPTEARKRRSGKSFFFRGLITLLPAIFTIFILVTLVDLVNRYVTSPINSTIYWSLEGNSLGWKILRQLEIDPYAIELLDPEALPQDLRDLRNTVGSTSEPFRESLAQYRAEKETFFRNSSELAISNSKLRRDVKGMVHPLVGVLVSLLFVLIFGYLASGFLGRRLVRGLDRAMKAIPVVRSVYPYTKQLVDFFLSDTEIEFDSVVAVPYPSPGLWSIGLVTGSGLKSLRERERRSMLSCFIPTSPMPMTGYTVFVCARDVVPLSLSVDEALRITVSGGVLVPPSEQVEDLEQGLLRASALEQTSEKGSRDSPQESSDSEDSGGGQSSRP